MAAETRTSNAGASSDLHAKHGSTREGKAQSNGASSDLEESETLVGSADWSWSACLGCLRDFRVHFCRRPSFGQVFFLVLFLVLFSTALTLLSTGYLQEGADWLKVHVGLWSHAIFVAVFLYTGLFFGYGWAFTVITSGYVVGWSAVVSVNVGSLLGGALGFLSARRCFKGPVLRKIQSLPPSWTRRIEFFQREISRSTRGYWMLSGMLRNSNLLTVGLVNAFDGAMTDVTLLQFLGCIFFMSQPMIWLQVYIGTLVDQLANAPADVDVGTATVANATAVRGRGEAAARQLALIVQLSIAVALAFLILVWARWRLRRLERVHQMEERRKAVQGQQGALAA